MYKCTKKVAVTEEPQAGFLYSF